jgi:hypothetical protein
MLLFLATAFGCANTQPIDIPYCARPEARAQVSEDCRAAPEVSAYQLGLIEAIDPELRSAFFGPLNINGEFDGDAVPTVCISSTEPPSVPWVVRQQLRSCNAALRRRYRSAPLCLAGTQLDLTDALAAASGNWLRNQSMNSGLTPDFGHAFPAAH